MPSPFITVTDLTNKVGRDLSADQGAIDACAEACDIVRNLTSQDFTRTFGDTLLLDGTGTDVLILPQLPVLGAGSIVVNGNPETDFCFTETGLLFRGSAGSTCYGYGYRPTWPVGRQNVQVTYDHGFGTVPGDVLAVARNLAARSIIQGAAISETVGAVNVRYAVAASDLTTNELRILQRYRSPRSC